MGVIFDLDQTLISSNEALELRRNRNWSEVYKMIPKLKPFSGIDNLVRKLNKKGIPVCIVTTSPSPYCSKVIEQWGWKNISTVCYHDTVHKKPHPEPIVKAIEILRVKKDDIVSVGDDPKDIEASKKAGVFSIGVLWGCNKPYELRASKPDIIFSTVEELDAFLTRKFNL